jgi:hypothetical protein
MEVSGQLHVQADLPPGKDPSSPFGQETGWTPEPVWSLRRRKKRIAPAANSIPAFQSAAPRYSYWDVPPSQTPAYKSLKSFSIFLRPSCRQVPGWSLKISYDHFPLQPFQIILSFYPAWTANMDCQKITIYWEATPCSLRDCRSFLRWRWRQHAPPKHR